MPIQIITLVPATGFSATGVNAQGNEGVLAINPAGILATGTITMPPAPAHGEKFTISSTQIITALTHSANTGQTLLGALTTLAALGRGSWVFNGPNTTWYPA